MKGCRGLTKQESEEVFNTLKTLRDKALFMLGLRTGMRISELLSLKIEDVLEHGDIASQITIAKRNTKGKAESKTVKLEKGAQVALKTYLGSLTAYDPQWPLFKSKKGLAAITRVQAHRVLKDAFNELKLEGKLATHTLRKTFAHLAHEKMGSKIEKTQVALCHRSLSSTAAYIQVNQKEVDEAILTMWDGA